MNARDLHFFQIQFLQFDFSDPRGGPQGCGELIKFLTDYFFEMSVRQYVSVKNGRDQYSLKNYTCAGAVLTF